MSWKVKDVQEQRFSFIEEYEREDLSLSALCQSYGISRPTGYKWIERYEQEGLGGLQDRSRAPHHRARAIAEGVKELILAVKAKHGYWGARKIVAHLGAKYPGQEWPAASSVGELLKQRGLTTARKRRQKAERTTEPLAYADEANRVWSVDFKGWFRTGDGQRCDPLTLTDNYSRYLLRCQVLKAETTAQVKPVMEAAFREYGLPERIRSDNGAPFASSGSSGLTGLSVWCIRLGIVPERIEPGCPQQNGRHERMHLTLKRETADPPAATGSKQQRRFDAFRQEYNQERPHEALQQRPPAQFFQVSRRPFPARVLPLEYPSSWQVRRVCSGGKFRQAGCLPFVSHALVGEYIGLEPLDDRYWRAWFGNYQLGVLDRTLAKILTPSQWQRQLARKISTSAAQVKT